MQNRFGRFALVVGFSIGIVVLTGCACHKSPGAAKEQEVTVDQVSAPARATIEKETASGHVDKITKELERGRTVYDVEATIAGRHMEYLVGDSDGALLGTEVPIAFGDLPQPVQVAAAKYFGGTAGLITMKGVEYGETQYEIEGKKGGRTVEVSFDPAGKVAK